MLQNLRELFVPVNIPLNKFLSKYVLLTDRTSEEEQRFQEYVYDLTNRSATVVLTGLLLIIQITWPTDYYYLSDPEIINTYFWWRIIGVTGIISILLARYFVDFFRQNFIFMTLIFVVPPYLFLTGYIFASFASFRDPWFSVVYVLPFMSIFIPISLVKRFLFTVSIPLLYFAGFAIRLWPAEKIPYFGIQVNLLASLIVISSIMGHGIYALVRQNFFQNEEIKEERQKSEQLLTNILPEEASERLKAGEDVSEKFDEVTVLFADIVEFTPIADHFEADEVVSILDEMFSSFDDLVNEYGLEKIKTIGDEYFVAAGVPKAIDKPTLRMANLAIEMQDEVQNHQRHDGSPFRLRCGMNTGPLVGGIIGKEKFVYDVWGDTVNIGSRMESKGEPGKIQVTPATKQALQAQDEDGQFEFEERGTIQVKGKGKITTYFLTKS